MGGNRADRFTNYTNTSAKEQNKWDIECQQAYASTPSQETNCPSFGTKRIACAHSFGPPTSCEDSPTQENSGASRELSFGEKITCGTTAIPVGVLRTMVPMAKNCTRREEKTKWEENADIVTDFGQHGTILLRER